MASQIHDNVSAILVNCRLSNVTDYNNQTLCVDDDFGRYPWPNDFYTIPRFTAWVLVDSTLCVVGMLCAGLALLVLCQSKKQQCNLPSFLFLQRTMVVTDLCFLLSYICSLILTVLFDKGYVDDVYLSNSSVVGRNYRFVEYVLGSVKRCVEMICVWLIAIIAIDR